MDAFNARSIMAEDEHALERTLGMARVRIEDFTVLRENCLVDKDKYEFVFIRDPQRKTSVYDPTTGKREMRPLFLLDTKSVTLEELEEEWYQGQFYFLEEPQQELKVIKGL